MTKDLAGKTALVTGASRGIGRGIAARLGAAGALVAVNYAENAAAARETVAAIEAAGGAAFAIKATVGAVGAAEALAMALDAELTARTGSNGLDILVHNVGIGDYKSIADTDDALLHRIFDSNVFGPFKLTRELLPRLRDEGRVINISSSATRLQDKDTIAYNMSKAAVEMFTKSLALELGPRRITVNSVAPGFTETDVNAGVIADPAMTKAICDSTLFKRFADVSDIADFVHALASDAGRWVTGQTIEASGGLRLA